MTYAAFSYNKRLDEQLSGIPNSILKQLELEITRLLTKLFRVSIREGYYPE